MMARGLLVHLNSDDPSMFHTDIGKEYVKMANAARLGSRDGARAQLQRRRGLLALRRREAAPAAGVRAKRSTGSRRSWPPQAPQQYDLFLVVADGGRPFRRRAHEENWVPVPSRCCRSSARSSAAGGGAAEATPIKAAWIYVGPHNDGGWSQAHDDGRQYVQKMLGDEGRDDLQGERPRGPADRPGDRQPRARRQQDHLRHLVRLHGRDGGGGEEVPGRLLRARHRHKTAQELREYFGAGEDAIYLSGMAAGAATKNGIVGYIVPFPIPEIIRHVNAFALGAQAVRPDAKVRLVWTNSGSTRRKEKKAAESLVAAGADVIGQNVDSPAAGQYAAVEGHPVGRATTSNAQKFAPTSWLTAALYDWGPYYLKRVKAALNGTWKTGSYCGTHEGRLRAARAVRAEGRRRRRRPRSTRRRRRLIAGTFYEFTGPLYDQSGKLRVPKGKRMTLPEILAMDWLVKGMIGSAKG